MMKIQFTKAWSSKYLTFYKWQENLKINDIILSITIALHVRQNVVPFQSLSIVGKDKKLREEKS